MGLGTEHITPEFSLDRSLGLRSSGRFGLAQLR